MDAQPFYGRVLDGGLLVLDRPKDYAKQVRSFAGKHVEVTIKQRRMKRTDPQNRYYFGVVVKLLALRYSTGEPSE